MGGLRLRTTTLIKSSHFLMCMTSSQSKMESHLRRSMISLRPEVLSRIHRQHISKDGCLRLARESVSHQISRQSKQAWDCLQKCHPKLEYRQQSGSELIYIKENSLVASWDTRGGSVLHEAKNAFSELSDDTKLSQLRSIIFHFAKDDECDSFKSTVLKSYFVLLKCLQRFFILAFTTLNLVFQESIDNQVRIICFLFSSIFFCARDIQLKMYCMFCREQQCLFRRATGLMWRTYEKMQRDHTTCHLSVSCNHNRA